MSVDNGDNHTIEAENPDLQAPDEFSQFGLRYLDFSKTLRHFFCREFLFDRALFLFNRFGRVPMQLMYHSGKNFLSEVERWEKKQHEKSLPLKPEVVSAHTKHIKQEPRDVIRRTRRRVNALSSGPLPKKERRIPLNKGLPAHIKSLYGDDFELRGYIVETPPSNVSLTDEEKELLSRGPFVACIFYIPNRDVHVVIERKFIIGIH